MTLFPVAGDKGERLEYVHAPSLAGRHHSTATTPRNTRQMVHVYSIRVRVNKLTSGGHRHPAIEAESRSQTLRPS
jgi:hypothetical protein